MSTSKIYISYIKLCQYMYVSVRLNILWKNFLYINIG